MKFLLESKIGDGWDENALEETGLMSWLDDADSLSYEINNTVRGYFSQASSYEELSDYLYMLGQQLTEIAKEVGKIEETE